MDPQRYGQLQEIFKRYDDGLGAKWACLAVIKDLKGGDAIIALDEAVPQIVAKWPGSVTPLHCDDSHAAGARLYLITHEEPQERRWIYGMVTVLYVAQCSGEAPILFSLNDFELQALRKTLDVLMKRRRSYTLEEYDDDDDVKIVFGDP